MEEEEHAVAGDETTSSPGGGDDGLGEKEQEQPVAAHDAKKEEEEEAAVVVGEEAGALGRPRHKADQEEEEAERKAGVLGRLRRRLGRNRGSPAVSLASSAVVDEFMGALRSSSSSAKEGAGGRKRKKAKATSSGVSTNLIRVMDSEKVDEWWPSQAGANSQEGEAGQPEKIARHVAQISWMGELEMEQKKKKKKQLELMLGLTLFDKVGEGDGCYGDQRYFTAPVGCALFVRPWEVKLYEPEANNLGQIHRVGFLSTRTPGASETGWKKRWFILTDDYLFFFRTPFSKAEVGRITIEPNNARSADASVTGRSHCLEVNVGEGQVIYLSAPDQASADGWLSALCALWPLSAARREGTMRHHTLLKEMVKGGFLKGGVSLPPAHFASRVTEDGPAAT